MTAARVTATHRATGAARTATSSAEGAYTIPNLPNGTYNVTASLIGFRRAFRNDVQVSGGETRVDFALEIQPLQAITVTAQLREEELADVPFSIAAPTAEVMRSRGVDNIETLAANMAGFSVQNLGPGQSQVAMRGASAGQIARDQPGVKEQVGAYLDDVPISLSLFTPDMDLFDITRVEVLRGPQGTLFGSGSLSGTVRYIANQPVLGVNSFFGEVGGSTINGGTAGGNLKLGVNLPLGDKAAARVAGWYNYLPGWMDAVQPDLSVDDNVNTGTRTGVRAAVRWEPSDKFSITPRIVYQRVDTDGWNRIDDFNILANPFTTTRPAVTLGERQLFTQIKEPFTDDYFLGDARIRYNFGSVDLTSITSFSTRDILVVRDATALTASITGGSIGEPESVYTLDAPLDDATNVNGFTQEIRLAGGAGGANRLRWVVGGFYTDNHRDYGQSLIVSGYQAATGTPTVGLRAQQDELFFSDLSYSFSQFAVFGEGTYALGDKLDLTAGLRYYNFSEDRDQVFDGIFAHDNTGTAVVSQPGSIEADGIAPRFIASYRASDALTGERAGLEGIPPWRDQRSPQRAALHGGGPGDVQWPRRLGGRIGMELRGRDEVHGHGWQGLPQPVPVHHGHPRPAVDCDRRFMLVQAGLQRPEGTEHGPRGRVCGDTQRAFRLCRLGELQQRRAAVHAHHHGYSGGGQRDSRRRGG
jgi:iron complex outermembrane receptor protein